MKKHADHAAADLRRFVDARWRDSILPRLTDYVRIPNKSPLFDPDWERNGHMEKAVQLLAAWCREQELPGATVEISRIPGRTPLLFVDIPGTGRDCVLLYGHLDKQPEFTGWHAGLGPWEPVIRDGKLYGRGGADDGYAVFASLTAIQALRQRGTPHARCVVLIEAAEESGSPDLPAHVDALAQRIATPSLVVCLDAECGNYDQLWGTTSLRGNVIGTLKVDILTEGVHSGSGSGVAPSAFRILRQLLSRIEHEVTGDLLLENLHVPIPAQRRTQAAATARVLGSTVEEKIPFVQGAQAVSNDPLELLLNSTWRPSLTVTGIDGLPPLRSAGNVLVPGVGAKLSFRLPPTCDPRTAAKSIESTLEADPPYGARVSFEVASAMGGWNAPALEDWLEAAMHRASRAHFGKDAMFMGTGGSIPFMGMLGERYPKTQFLVTGLLGPHSNAHGPNEFLHIETGQRLTACVADILAEHYSRTGTEGSKQASPA
jgi:acetylornithine deacetylase/succinyl-diaminopimelate desuccinylase-like protein